jgi:hypothetical protein
MGFKTSWEVQWSKVSGPVRYKRVRHASAVWNRPFPVIHIPAQFSAVYSGTLFLSAVILYVLWSGTFVEPLPILPDPNCHALREYRSCHAADKIDYVYICLPNDSPVCMGRKSDSQCPRCCCYPASSRITQVLTGFPVQPLQVAHI